MKVLITGGMGFIGKAVTRRLLECTNGSIIIVIVDDLMPKVHGEDPKPYDFHDPRVQFIKGDVALREVIERPLRSCDAVIHLAAETGTGQSMYEIEHYNRINISATALMVDILTNKKNRIRKFLIASSRAVYGEGKYYCDSHGVVYPRQRLTVDMDKGDFDVKCPCCQRTAQVLATNEDSLLHPTSFYGITKHTQESIIMTLCQNIDIAPVALRYQNVYGPGQSLTNPYTGILSIFSNRIRCNRDIEVYEDGLETRDFVFVDDVADITVKALFSEEAGGNIFNVGSGVPVSVMYVARKLRELFSSDIQIKVSGKFRVGDIRHNYADISRIQTIMGYVPKVTIDEGLSRFVDWVKKQGPCPDLYNESLEELKNKGLYR